MKKDVALIGLIICLGLTFVTLSVAAENAEELYAQSKQHYLSHEYDTAISKLNTIVSNLKPESGPSWLLLAECYVAKREYVKAIPKAVTALRYLPPGTPDRERAEELIMQCSGPQANEYEDLLDAYVQRNWPRVIDLGERIISETSVEFADAFYFVGVAYLKQGRNPVRGRELLRNYLSRASDGKYAESARDLIETYDETRFHSVVQEIDRLLVEGRLEEARKRLEEARNLRQEGHDLTYLAALQYVLNGQEARAIGEFRAYLRNAPSGPYYAQSKNWIYQLERPWLVVIEDGTLKRIFTDGTRPRRISRPEHGVVEQGLMSPDGSMVAFVAWNEKPNTRNVFVCDAFGNKPHGIFESSGDKAAIRDMEWFQHDRGLWLTFVAEDKSRDYGIFLYSDAEKDPAFMLEGSRSAPADAKNLRCKWSPDAEHLAWTGGDGCLRATQLSTLRTGVKLEQRFTVRDFAWGPRVSNDLPGFLVWTDGEHIYRRDVTPQFLQPENDARSHVEIDRAHISRLGVSSDGTVLGAYDRREERLHLYVVHPEKRKLGTYDNVREFAFSTVGRQLAFRTDDSLFVTNMVRNIPPTRVQGTRGITKFAWSPATIELLVWQNDWVCITVDGKRRADGRPRETTGPFVRPRWSPDAIRVVIQRNDAEIDEAGGIWVLTRELPEPEQLHIVLPKNEGPYNLVGWTS